MSEVGDCYAELMAPAWERGLADISEILILDVAPIVKWAHCQQQVKAELDKIDWENSGLPVPPRQDERQISERMPLTQREQAERFLSFNFSDNYQIITLATETAAEAELSIDNHFVDILKRSKRNLLLPSRLADPIKSALFKSVQDPYLREVFDGPYFEGRPIIYQAETDSFDWHPSIREWGLERLDPEYGCPANGILTTTEPRMPLTFFFWDRLVEAMYYRS